MKKVRVVFWMIVFVQVICLAYFANVKQGYFVDELWSYGLANSFYHPHVFSDDALEQKWVPGDYFREYLEVSPNERFRYDSVIYNQMKDYHPPLFYAVLHTVCSFFTNSFSKWYGIIPNIFYFVISNLLLFSLAKKFFKNEWLALLPPLAYGFSAGAISNVVYIRMYVLLTIWILLTLDLHGKWLLKGTMTKKELICLVIVSYLGYMSHYYFFIFAFFVSVFYLGYLLIKKDRQGSWRYCKAMFASLMLVLVTFPIAYVKLFFGQRGSEAVHNLFDLSNLVQNARRYGEIIGEGLFADTQKFLLYAIALGILVTTVKNIKSNFSIIYDEKNAARKICFCGQNIKVQPEKATYKITALLAFSAMGYFVIILKVAPYQVDRYVFGIYPVLMLLMLFVIYQLLHYWMSDKKAAYILLALICVFTTGGIAKNHIQYLYRNHQENIGIMEQLEGSDCLYVTWNYYKLVGNALELEHMGRVYTIVPDRLEELPKILDAEKDKLVVYIDEELNQEDVLSRICNASEYMKYRKLFESRCVAYEMER